MSALLMTRIEGTWIVPKEELMEKPMVSAVTHDAQAAIIKMVSLPQELKSLISF